MSIIYATTLKNTRLNDVTTVLGTAGVLVIGTSALAGTSTGVLATFPLNNPAAGLASGGILTFSGTPIATTASAGGTAAKAELRDSGGTVWASGLTVNTSGADVIVTTTTITSGGPVTLTAATITHG